MRVTMQDEVKDEEEGKDEEEEEEGRVGRVARSMRSPEKIISISSNRRGAYDGRPAKRVR